MPQRDTSLPLPASLLRDAEAELRRQVQPWVADAGCEISSLRISDMSEHVFIDPSTLEPDFSRPNEELLIEMDLRDDSGALFPLSYPVSVSRMTKDFQSATCDVSESMMSAHSERLQIWRAFGIESAIEKERPRIRSWPLVEKLDKPEQRNDRNRTFRLEDQQWPKTVAMPGCRVGC